MMPLTRLLIFGAGMAIGLIASGAVAAADKERIKRRKTLIRPMRPARPRFYDRELKPRSTTWA